MNRFSVIYADPPWRYGDKRIGRGGAERYYRTMRPQDIRAMAVEQLAADDCALLLWATAPMMAAGLSVIRAWGFEFTTVAFTWVKRSRGQVKAGGALEFGKLAWGTGAYTRANAEHCLLGTRGSPKVASHSVHSIIEAPRGIHSEKPAEARRRIEQLFGDVPRIELFARQAAPGWARWGLEAPSGDGLVNLSA